MHQKYPNYILKAHFLDSRVLPCEIKRNQFKLEREEQNGEDYLLYNDDFYFWMYHTDTFKDDFLYFTPANQSSCPTDVGASSGDGGTDGGDTATGDGDFGGSGDGGGDLGGSGDGGGCGAGGDFGDGGGGDGGDGGDAGGGG